MQKPLAFCSSGAAMRDSNRQLTYDDESVFSQPISSDWSDPAGAGCAQGMRRLSVRPRYWLGRMILSCWVLSNTLITMFRPESLSAQRFLDAGPFGAFVLLLLLLLTSIAVLDGVVNDLMPTRFAFRQGVAYRHIGFMAIAICLTLEASVIALRDGVTVLLVAYFLPASFAVVLTFFDLFARHRKGVAP